MGDWVQSIQSTAYHSGYHTDHWDASMPFWVVFQPSSLASMISLDIWGINSTVIYSIDEQEKSFVLIHLLFSQVFLYILKLFCGVMENWHVVVWLPGGCVPLWLSVWTMGLLSSCTEGSFLMRSCAQLLWEMFPGEINDLEKSSTS